MSGNELRDKMEKARKKKEMQEQQQEQVRKQLKKIASKILTKKARSRLGNLRAAKPELASQIEMQLVQLYKAGQIQDEINDDQLKRLLKKLQQSGEERNIKY
ncbi:MAG: DNA-binding protein [Candidatus Nanohaloarchaea archaeon]|nr:DNA-binding protein [Candidatus Nanohaloarchaea archaeon]